MKVGDLVRHKHGTLSGYGLIVEAPVESGPYAGDPNRCMIMWHCSGHVAYQSLDQRYMEVISESR